MTIIIVAAVLCVGALLAWPRVAAHQGWRATITPLASIIGSGFLILGPILAASFGLWAPAAMAGLCVLAYAFGAAIRVNIAQGEGRSSTTIGQGIETISEVVLAFAYVISVAYYLNLFGAFGVNLTPVDSDLAARVVTSAVFAVILVVGWRWGFDALERLEQVSVGVKLAIIAGLLAALAVQFSTQASAQTLVFNTPTVSGWASVTLMFGLIVTVQGFETSRYLGATYSSGLRVKSMRWAQWISTGIYMIYIGLLSYLFEAEVLEVSETAIIDLMGQVAPILPLLLVAAALSAQFSAAVADTGGSGGLMVEVSRGRLSVAQGYAVVVGAGLVLTWTMDVFEIVAYASRAFALYYALQAALAAVCMWREGASVRAIAFTMLAVLGIVITMFGRAVEGV